MRNWFENTVLSKAGGAVLKDTASNKGAGEAGEAEGAIPSLRMEKL